VLGDALRSPLGTTAEHGQVDSYPHLDNRALGCSGAGRASRVARRGSRVSGGLERDPSYHPRVPDPEPTVLTEGVREFLDQRHFASLGTVGADGSPHQAIIWYRLDPDGQVMINSREGRRWPADLKRDPRASLAVFWSEDPNRWVGITGVVDEVIEDVERARDDIVALAHRYNDASESSIASFRSQQRVSFLIRIQRIHDHLQDD
jgi:PPOX class probable F420-dependent enzyme